MVEYEEYFQIFEGGFFLYASGSNFYQNVFAIRRLFLNIETRAITNMNIKRQRWEVTIILQIIYRIRFQCNEFLYEIFFKKKKN